MRHITNVLVHSNRCEVVDGHIFATGDKGLPHIRLKFLYMFGETSLQGKSLECKYLLPNGKYSAEAVRITQKDEVTFQIHYSCFAVNGWTTLRITLVNDSNRVTLEDIIIKTKETKLGEQFSNTQVEEAITKAIEVTTTSIREEGDSIKRELKEYIEKEKKNLKGEQGDKGQKGLDGIGVSNITSSQEDDTVTLDFLMTNDTHKNIRFSVPQFSSGGSSGGALKVEVEKIWDGQSKNLIFGKPLANYHFLQIQNTTQTATIPAKTGSKFNLSGAQGEVQKNKISMSRENKYTLYGIKLKGQVADSNSADLSEYYNKQEANDTFAYKRHFHDELLSESEADGRYIMQSLAGSFARLDNSVRFANITASGDILAQGTVTAMSDIRLKSDLEKIKNPLEKLKQLNGYTFTMNGERHIGVVAQEVQKVLPEAVRETEDGYLSVTYGNMAGLLIEAIKKLQQEIEVLKHASK